jgi:catechol 2,3-dioxygenase-like lactoylglutathione lyase family enzyme
MKRIIWIALLLLTTLSSLPENPPSRSPIFSIAFVRFKTTAPDKAVAFYRGTLGLRPAAAECHGTPGPCFRVNETQHIELIQGDSNASGSFLDAIGLRVENVEQTRNYLTSHGLACSEVTRGPNSLRFISALDPEGHQLVFVESLGISGGPDQIDTSGQMSHSLIHAGFVVKDRVAEDKFYRDLLGFHPYWHGGMKNDKDDWASLQVPDGTNWVEYMLHISPTADKHTLGVMNHIALGVPDIHAAEAQLRKNGWTGTEQPKIGRDGKWQLNLYDPDDTRVELMEFTPTQKPCCSEYTGPHPGPKP